MFAQARTVTLGVRDAVASGKRSALWASRRWRLSNIEHETQD